MNRDDSLSNVEITFSKDENIVENEVIKTLYYEVRPMSIEDAILKLNEKNQNIFYTFINIDTNKVNVLFKLKDSNNYGIVEPEM